MYIVCQDISHKALQRLVQILEMLLDCLWVCDAEAIVQQLLGALLKAVEDKVLLLIPILVAHLGLWREWIKVRELGLTCMSTKCIKVLIKAPKC